MIQVVVLVIIKELYSASDVRSAVFLPTRTVPLFSWYQPLNLLIIHTITYNITASVQTPTSHWPCISRICNTRCATWQILSQMSHVRFWIKICHDRLVARQTERLRACVSCPIRRLLSLLQSVPPTSSVLSIQFSTVCLWLQNVRYDVCVWDIKSTSHHFRYSYF
jgi:hypothetical protein